MSLLKEFAMIRSLAVLATIALGLNATQAQEIVPAAPTPAPAPVAAPAPTDIEINPGTPVGVGSKQTNLLTGFYATLAVIDICDVPVSDAVKGGMAGDQKRLETSVGLDAPGAVEAYAKVRAEVEATTPDCAAGSPDRASVDAVTAIYEAAAAQPAAPAAAEGAPATEGAPAAIVPQ